MLRWAVIFLIIAFSYWRYQQGEESRNFLASLIQRASLDWVLTRGLLLARHAREVAPVFLFQWFRSCLRASSQHKNQSQNW